MISDEKTIARYRIRIVGPLSGFLVRGTVHFDYQVTSQKPNTSRYDRVEEQMSPLAVLQSAMLFATGQTTLYEPSMICVIP